MRTIACNIGSIAHDCSSEVHKAVHRERGNTVALKRILMHNEKEGMPVTALREIKILKSLHHRNIIDIEDMFIVKSAYTLLGETPCT